MLKDVLHILYTKVIPLFHKHKIEETKLLDFQDFYKAANFIKNKTHLTIEELEKIKLIKSRMNKARYKKDTWPSG